jgi:hypothetical protein
LLGKELTQVLSHLPKLSISTCQMGVAVEQQQPTSHVPSPSASADRTEDAQATCLQQEIAEEAEKGDDGLLLLPANLSGSPRVRMVLFSLFLARLLPVRLPPARL